MGVISIPFTRVCLTECQIAPFFLPVHSAQCITHRYFTEYVGVISIAVDSSFYGRHFDRCLLERVWGTVRSRRSSFLFSLHNVLFTDILAKTWASFQSLFTRACLTDCQIAPFFLPVQSTQCITHKYFIEKKCWPTSFSVGHSRLLHSHDRRDDRRDEWSLYCIADRAHL